MSLRYPSPTWRVGVTAYRLPAARPIEPTRFYRSQAKRAATAMGRALRAWQRERRHPISSRLLIQLTARKVKR